MFGWFQPLCPLDTAEKAWVELRMNWLSAKLGQQRLLHATVMLPTPEFFPDELDGSAEDASKVFRRLCNHVKVDPQDILLSVESNPAMTGAAGLYIQEIPPRILVNEFELSDSESLVAILAHELAHHRLMGEQRVSGEEFDNELLTDLTTVVLGLGLFLARSPRNWRSQYFKWEATDFNRTEYMSPPMFGHALAHLAWFENDRRPHWIRHLPYEARHSLKQAIRYLFETGDSSFTPQSLREM